MQLALGLGGAALGFMVGGPAGAQIGFMIGSFVGSLLDPAKQEGPRREDKKLQHSSYGSPIPVYWGTVRGAGNVIWQPEEMTEHKQTSSGKGGPKVTTYTYSASFAIQLCAARRFGEEAILGIRRIWADARLVSENGEPTDDFNFTLYLGGEDQEPDPTIEADKGVGNVPAYRGIAYIVFNELYLTDFGDRIPSFEFEIEASGIGKVSKVCSFDDPLLSMSYTGHAGMLTGTHLDGNELVVSIYEEDTPNSWYTEQRYNVRTGELLDTSRRIDVINPGGPGWSLISWVTSSNSDIAAGNNRGTGSDGLDEIFWYRAGVKGEAIYPPNGEEGGFSAYFDTIMARPFLHKDFVYSIASTSNINGRLRIYKWGIRPSTNAPASTAEDDFFDYTSHSVIYNTPGSASGASCTINFDDEGFLYMLGPGTSSATHELFKIDPSDMTLVDQWYFNRFTDLRDPTNTHVAEPSNNVNSQGFTVYRGMLALHGTDTTSPSGTSIELYELTPSGSPSALPWLDYEDFDTVRGGGGWNTIGGGYFVTNEGVFRIAGIETLDNVVEDISVMAGLTEEQVDVTDLTDVVPGYRLASQMTARNGIEPLRQAYFFDGAEIDEKIVFKHRTHDPIIEIHDIDLAAHEHGAESPPLLETERLPDHELPKRVNVVYINSFMDYQPSTQYDERQYGNSTSEVTLDIPLVMSDDFARSVAGIQVFVGLLERERGTIYTTRKYEYLVPTDVITVQGRTWRIINKRSMKSGVVEFNLLPTKAILFEQPTNVGVFSGGSPEGSQTIVGSKVDTQLVLLDIPILSESDAPFGFYAAMGPVSTGGVWPGAALFKSIDGGTTFTEIAATSTAASIGIAENTLANYTGNLDYIDDTGYVDISLTDQRITLSSTTATGLANGQNLAALKCGSGWELFQYQDAILISGGRYRLYNLLRGVKGSSAYINGHADGNTFVALPCLNVSAPEAELNVPLLYKAITFGKTNGTVITFTNTGLSTTTYWNTVTPYIPVFGGDIGSPGNGYRVGLVPAPSVGDCAAGKFLSACGDWRVPAGSGVGGSIYAYDEGGFLGAIQGINLVGTNATLTLTGSPQIALLDIKGNMVVVNVAYSTPLTVDLTNYQKYTRIVLDIGTLTGNISLNLTNGADGQVIIVRLKQDATGGRTFSAGSNLRFSTSLPSPVLSTVGNRLDRLAFEWYGGPGSPSGSADLVAINLGY